MHMSGSVPAKEVGPTRASVGVSAHCQCVAMHFQMQLYVIYDSIQQTDPSISHSDFSKQH